MPLSIEFTRLLTQYWSGSESVLNPRDLKRKIAVENTGFAGFQQQDTHELLMVLLSKLQSETNTASPVDDAERPPRGDGTNDADLADRSWSFELRKNDSPVFTLLNGLQQNKIVCPTCGRTEVWYDSFESVPVPIARPRRPIQVTVIPSDPDAPFTTLSPLFEPDVSLADVESEIKRLCHLDDSLSFVFASQDLFSGAVALTTDAVLSSGVLLALEVPDRALTYFIAVPTVSDFLIGRGVPNPFLVAAGPDLARRVRARLDRFWGAPCEPSADDLAFASSPGVDFGGERFVVEEPRQPPVPHAAYPFVYDSVVAVHLNAEEMTAERGFRFAAARNSAAVGAGEDKDRLEERLRLAGSFAPLPDWHCATCNVKVNPRKSVRLWAVAPLFIIQLGRFTHDPGSKNNRLIEYPEVLDLAQFVIGPQKERTLNYRLIGVIPHFGGNIIAGHYAAVAWNYATQKWYAFSDDLCKEATKEDIHTRLAYLLFYERIEREDDKE
jgi:hypothetical protein